MVKITKGMEGFVEVSSGHLGPADYLREDQVLAIQEFAEDHSYSPSGFEIVSCEYIDNTFFIFYGKDEDEFLEIPKEDYPALYEWNEDQWESQSRIFHAD